MAEEVGSAWVSILPSMRGFSKLLQAELRKELRSISGGAVQVPVQLDTTTVARQVTHLDRTVRTQVEAGGIGIGKLLGDGAGSAFIDAFRPAATLGFSGLSGLGTAFASNPVTATIGAALGAAISGFAISAVAAAFTSGAGLLAGGGILGLGAFALRGDKKLVDQFKKTFAGISDELAKAAKPLSGPFQAGLKAIGKTFKSLTPDLKALFKGVSPIVKILTDSLGPTLKPILAGLKSSMPGIVAAFRGLGKALPNIGQAIGRFFSTIFQDEDLIERITQGFGDFVGFLLDVAGPTIRFFTLTWGALTNAVILFKKFLSEDLSNALATFETFTGGALGRIVNAWAPLKEAIGKVWDAFVGFANANTDAERQKTFVKLVDSIKAAWGPLKTFIGTVWDEVWAYVKRVWNEKVVPWWNNTAKPWIKREIGDFIKGVFTGLVSSAFTQGKAIVQGLINGLKAMTGPLGSAVGGIASIIGSFFPNSPQAKQGPLSGHGNPFSRGQAIATGIAAGAQSQMPTVNGAASQLAGSFGIGGTGGAAAMATQQPWFVSDGSRVGDLLVAILSETLTTRYQGDVNALVTRR